MERIVIVGYQPIPGKESELLQLISSHVPRLRQEGLVSAREPIAMQAEDGTIIEIFGWASEEAIEKAHSNSEVQKMWGEFAAVCNYIPAGSIPEMRELFSEFKPID